MGSFIFQVNCNILLLRSGVRCSVTMPATTLVEKWTGQEGVELQDGPNSINPFSEFLNPVGRFAFMNKRDHYYHHLGFCLSDLYSCHGCVEQVSLKENVPKSIPPFSGVVPSWVHAFSKSTATSSCRTQAAPSFIKKNGMQTHNSES
jgi:hypothetical protein